MMILLCLCVAISALCSVQGQEESQCVTPDGGVGICKSIYSCESLVAKVNEYKTAPPDQQPGILNELQKRKCGFDGESWKVCCSDCTTPDDKSGVKQHIRNCPHLLSLLSKGSRRDLMFIKRSRINATMVCCGPAPEGAPPTNEQCNSMFSSPVAPSTGCCGVDSSAGSKITGGRTTSIREFPWLVLLEYNITGEIKLYCGGSLISNRYVITASHCFKRPPINVRVGEFDTHNPGQDCTELPDGTRECTDGAESIPVESYLSHPRDDIGIVKLKRAVNYTDFVRPICLPTTDIPDPAAFDVAGWGKLNDTSDLSRYKQAVDVALFKSETVFKRHCERRICAGGEPGKDSCKGDSGGPLMRQLTTTPAHYALAGVVSSGPSKCGTPGLPGLYAHVYRNIEWIRNNIQ